MTDEEEFKKIMLDFSEVSPNCLQSVQKYGKRCALAGEIYSGMKWGEKEVARLQKEIERLQISKNIPLKKSPPLPEISYMEQVEKAINHTKMRQAEIDQDHINVILEKE